MKGFEVTTVAFIQNMVHTHNKDVQKPIVLYLIDLEQALLFYTFKYYGHKLWSNVTSTLKCLKKGSI